MNQLPQIKPIEFWINKLQLQPHPEGGYYKEIYRSSDWVQFDGFDSPRNICTSIYYVLTKHSFSSFHRLKSDELWHFHYGHPAVVHIINEKGHHESKIVGIDEHGNGDFQIIIPKNSWFCAETFCDYSLVGCTVAPGFNFLDFEMGDRNKLLEMFPQHEELITKFCR